MKKVNSCLVPKPSKDAAVYTRLRDALIKAHCENERGAHKCCGAITLTRTSITLTCPLCGDHRSLL